MPTQNHRVHFVDADGTAAGPPQQTLELVNVQTYKRTMTSPRSVRTKST